ncbi:MAG: alpha-hydroxy acid oxidase [Bacteroidota bacterium]
METQMDLKQLGRFMDKTFDGRLNEEKVKTLRDKWAGNLVVKGVVNPRDMEKLLQIGVDGVIVSNHGGRQLDAGASSFKSLQNLTAEFGAKTTIMMDGGIQSGPDIARCLSAGAKYVFLGRAFMYGVAALGKNGGEHTCLLLKKQLKQVMEQLGCESIDALPQCLLTKQ